MASNTAAWLPTAKAHPLEVKSAPYPTPGANEIVVKVATVGLNPIDWMIQAMGPALFNHIKYPFIGGTDVAGEVVELGSDVSRVKVGDHVLGLALGFANNDHREGGFQKYTILKTHMMSPFPASLSMESAAVLPLGLCTAASALYQKDYLALEYPSVNPKATGKSILIWAGSSSVGSNAIQLAVASGYEVITTASPKNFDYCKKLGASQVFDYHSPSITQELLDVFKDKVIAGAFAILPGSAEPCLEVVQKTEGNKFVVFALPPPDKLPEGISAKFVFGSTLKNNEVSGVIFEDFLPKALAQGKYVCAPEPLVVAKGLESVQTGFDRIKKGMSAQKGIITL